VIFLDINTFFSPKAGGIRTYHQAKMAWFQSQSQDHYFLVYPGSTRRPQILGPQVSLQEFYGPAVTGDPSGYRILMDFLGIFRLILKVKPDVLEAGDPWITGLFCLALKKSGWYKGLLVSFYHSDPVPSYFQPWAKKRRFKFFKALLVRLAAKIFYRIQGGYDLTAVASRTMEESLVKHGVRSVAYLPFGVPDLFFANLPIRNSGTKKLLYAGRLDSEKGIELFLASLPSLLANVTVEISVLGRGSFAEKVRAINHPRFHYLGFLESQEAVREVYDSHDILLAPGPFETFGLGVLEAMARGMVVVGPDRGGTAELLRQMGSPFIFTADDLKDFLRVTGLAIACDWARESEKARELALSYGSWDKAVRRMNACYANYWNDANSGMNS
jgi:alpha-1,6-mannosyltransferase